MKGLAALLVRFNTYCVKKGEKEVCVKLSNVSDNIVFKQFVHSVVYPTYINI